jgi:hypothetical protein
MGIDCKVGHIISYFVQSGQCLRRDMEVLLSIKAALPPPPNSRVFGSLPRSLQSQRTSSAFEYIKFMIII